ncbi:MAG TPA: orotate phosphoribosyltransferase [Candidatus Borkfalkia faecavium]|uniref:Orotate phosphoribosyltransferase n=2 Tax=Candidatus Borkfalkia TaxID=2508948 RepID=A0A9D2AU72_9FIRM|nr:orotate phosphoribosyltransferase [Candidatus Borkfalkia faecigallinarum]HIX50063.1 orotate phosphoribosyltransferase [Candidatus Borkfalkia faecavium]
MTYKQEFIRFLADCGVLKFGTFRLKSGRIAPYFLNAGEYKTGAQIKRLGEFYAACIRENDLDVQTLFGPAYKGVPLAISAAVAMYEKYGRDVSFCFDRKEVKDHGEGGMFVGKQPQDGEKIVIIEDVMTSGKALKEVLPKLRGAANVNITGMVITVDRMEKALGSEKSAVQQAWDEEGVRVCSIVTIRDIIDALEEGIIEGKEHVPAIRAYLQEYGANYGGCI